LFLKTFSKGFFSNNFPKVKQFLGTSQVFQKFSTHGNFDLAREWHYQIAQHFTLGIKIL